MRSCCPESGCRCNRRSVSIRRRDVDADGHRQSPPHVPQLGDAAARRPCAGRRSRADQHRLPLQHHGAGLLAQRRPRSLVRDLLATVHVAQRSADDHVGTGAGQPWAALHHPDPTGGVDRQGLLVRRAATTHTIDGDQRAVSLPIVSRTATSVRVRIPAQRAVIPAGPYMLFVNRSTSSGLVPSVSKPVMVLGADASCTDG